MESGRNVVARERRRILSALIVVVGATVAASGAVAATGCQLTRLAEIPVTIRPDPTKGNVVSLQFDGRVKDQDVQMGFFDGTNSSAQINQEAAEKFGWSVSKLPPPFPNGLIGSANIDGLRLGMVEITGLLAVVRARSAGGLSHIDIGPEAFANVDVEYDLAHGRMALFASEHCPNADVYWTKDWFEIPFDYDRRGRVVFDVKVNGVKVKAGLNPSHPSSTITRRMQSLAGITPGDEAAPVKIATLEFGGVTISGVTASTLSFNALTWVAGDRERVDAHQAGLTEFNFGLSEMKKFRLFVSRSDQKIFFTLPNDS